MSNDLITISLLIIAFTNLIYLIFFIILIVILGRLIKRSRELLDRIETTVGALKRGFIDTIIKILR